MENAIWFIMLGLAAGVLSGLIGIGGGVLIVPALVFLFGFSQHQAQGTTLALMVPPIGLLAAWAYYTQGFVEVKAAAWIGLGFVAGGSLAPVWPLGLPGNNWRRCLALSSCSSPSE